MPGRERLADEGAVAVAVEIDFVDLQRIQHGGNVVGGEMRAVEIRLRAELIGARFQRGGIARIARLNFRTIDRAGGSRAALVDDDHVAMFAQRAEDVEIRVARASAGIARPAFLRQQRAARRRALVEARVVLETDRDRAPDPACRIERPLELTAITVVVGIAKFQCQRADGDLLRRRGRGSLGVGSCGDGRGQKKDREPGGQAGLRTHGVSLQRRVVLRPLMRSWAALVKCFCAPNS